MNWLTYFEHNRANRLPILWEHGIQVEPHLREPLIQSLQRFQIGESGDGVHLKRGAAATGDAGYMAAMTLFIAEEQEHARLLARILQDLRAPLLRSHWSDACFILLRHLSGLQLELMVLLAAEMIAKRYYRALYEGTHDPVLRAVFTQILRDEDGHIAFHTDHLHSAFASWPLVLRRVVLFGWWLVFCIVCLVVMSDHRAVLKAVRVSPSAFWRDCSEIFEQVATQIFMTKSVLHTGAIQ